MAPMKRPDGRGKIFNKHYVSPHVVLKTWDGYAIMLMIESGLGISIVRPRRAPSSQTRLAHQGFPKPSGKPGTKEVLAT